MKKGILLTALILTANIAMAAEHAAHHDEGIPLKAIASQAFNFVLLIVLLYVLLKDKISAHFRGRADQYNELVQRAEKDRREAEAARKEIQTKLNNLVSNSEADLARVRSEAEDLKKKIIADAEAISRKLEEDAKQSIALEIEKAKTSMRNEVLMAALKNAEIGLKTSIKDPEHHKLQHDFIQKMKAVN